jgi:glutathione-S-conjugate glycine hydrolase
MNLVRCWLLTGWTSRSSTQATRTWTNSGGLPLRIWQTANACVLVNYLRKAIEQEAGGHISPLAAYDADTDRFPILDVSRYKYPPVWVEAESLFAAMNTPDADNGNRSRGYVVVGR